MVNLHEWKLSSLPTNKKVCCVASLTPRFNHGQEKVLHFTARVIVQVVANLQANTPFTSGALNRTSHTHALASHLDDLACLSLFEKYLA